jgi:hypothetical protein
MSLSISALRTRRLFRAAALFVSVLFITGQVFNCCLINESFARSVKDLFRPRAAKVLYAEAGEDAHPHCHGHAAESEAGGLVAERTSPLDSHFAQDGTCLSENAFSTKPMVASDFAQAPIPLFAVGWVIHPELPRSFYFERPRPQNKSSPPLYLTTLRLLV